MEKKSLRWVSYNDKFYYNGKLCHLPDQAYGGETQNGVTKYQVEDDEGNKEWVDHDISVIVVAHH